RSRWTQVVALLEPVEERVVTAVLGLVPDPKVAIDLASELTDLTLGSRSTWVTPTGHRQHASEVDGLGVGHDRRDRVAWRQPAGQGSTFEECSDQRFPPIKVESAARPDLGDVGRLGDGVRCDLAAVATDQPEVASL